MPKFLMSVTRDQMKQLKEEAERRNARSVQEVLRTVIIPEWFATRVKEKG